MTPSDQSESILEYSENESSSSTKLVTRRKDLPRRPKLDAPPANQPGSVDWVVTNLFGTTEEGVRHIESLVAGQGDQAREVWIRFCLLYREWEAKYRAGQLEHKPTLNQVCHSLNFDAREFLGELQKETQNVMAKMGHMKAALKVPQMVDVVVNRVLSGKGSTADNELGLKLGGIISDKNGVQVNVQQNNNNTTTLQRDRDRMKNPLLQFSETVEKIDDEVRGEIVEGEIVDVQSSNPKE